MVTSPASTLRDLAAKATPGEWDVSTDSLIAVDPDGPDMVLIAGFERWDDAHLASYAPDLAVLCADMADALERARDTAQIVASGCDTGHLDFTIDDAHALLARFATLVAPEEGRA